MVLFCFFPSSFPFQLWLEINFNQVVGASVSIRAQTRHVVHANSSVYLPTVVLAWRRSGAGCTYEEPGSGEPDSSQRCVSEREIEIERGVRGFPVLLVTKYLSPVAVVLFVSGGDHERSPAEAGGQSGRAGKEPCANSCQGRRLPAT